MSFTSTFVIVQFSIELIQKMQNKRDFLFCILMLKKLINSEGYGKKVYQTS